MTFYSVHRRRKFKKPAQQSANTKRVLFVIDSLGNGGAEKSLVSLLRLLSREEMDIDLIMFGHGGINEKYLPDSIHIIPLTHLKRRGPAAVFSHLTRRVWLATWLRYDKRPSNWRESYRHYNLLLKHDLEWPTIYDVAIAYGQHAPTYFVAEKVNAKYKMAWVNAQAIDFPEKIAAEKKFYDRIDLVVPVSEAVRDSLYKNMPYASHKMTIVRDIVNPEFIETLSAQRADFTLDHTKPAILSIGRLQTYQKGYDFSIRACRLLKDRGYDFNWYVIGEGRDEDEIRRFVTENQVEDRFILLGTTPNPYSVIRQCNMLVHAARIEGFGLVIAEAKILNKPCVCTDFPAAKLQIEHEVTGLIAQQNAESLADNIARLLDKPELVKQLSLRLENEPKGNIEEVEVVKKLINECPRF